MDILFLLGDKNMKSIRSICVFCGSNTGYDENYKKITIELADYLAVHHYRLVYGGGRLGLMGVLGNEMLNKGGDVLGVIPKVLVNEKLARIPNDKIITTADISERKQYMLDASDAFIALPGGFGTFEEFFTMLSWSQINLHQNPLALLNVDGFYEPLIQLLNQAAEAGFAPKENLDLFVTAKHIPELFEKMGSFRHTQPTKWTN
ncbi:decarboxylase [Pediococcus ethanolidurans]|uniref:Cytokinin riboside 5'-monophosphate phosphoribohydrolase n=2 Tax=Pediococcus ethanolidurans TaxID=319653 RepID=A0A0R2K8I6_9LACO|nr:decarboxylase [Pediococcus ethanolidurans]